MSTPSALQHLRVIDLTDVSGAYCGKLLADMGADVVLVEPSDGSPMRTMGPFWESASGLPYSLLFAHYNTSKRSVVLDLDTAAQRTTLRRLMASSDVVIETFRPGDLAERGLDYTDLVAINPRLVWVSITPFGRTGPYRRYRGSDLVCQAIGGATYLNGTANEAPLPGAGLQAYHGAALHAAVATLGALLARNRNGRGRHIDLSIQECVMAYVEHATTLFRREGVVAQRQGSLHWTGDFRVSQAVDGYVMLSALGDWTTLAQWVTDGDRNAVLADERWDDAEYRRAHAQSVFDGLDAWAAAHSVDRLVAAAQSRRLPFGAVRSVIDLVDDAQLSARNFFVPVEHDELRTTLKYPGAPYVFSRSAWRIGRRPPLLGEHTSEVVSEIDHRPVPATPRTTTAQPEVRGGPLIGVRVMDFTWAVAGPLATRALADLGAEVIKIERPGSSSKDRRRSRQGDLNRGKQSVAVDLDRAEGRDLVYRLVAMADVVIDNFSPRVMANWGLDYSGLTRLRPDIINVSMSAFGLTGPRRDHVAYGPTLQAEAGYNSLMRDASDAPVGWGFSFSDMVAGWSGALAVLLAVWHRLETGEGQLVDLSQFENLVSLHGAPLLALLNPATARAAAPSFSAAPFDDPSRRRAAPYRCATASEGRAATGQWCAIDILGDFDWKRFCKAIGEPQWTHDARFASIAGRADHPIELVKHIEAWTLQRRADDVMKVLQEAGIAAGVVETAADLCCRDPQLEWRRKQGSEPAAPTAARHAEPLEPIEPMIGEHTDAVLCRLLGLSTNEIAVLRATGVVA